MKFAILIFYLNKVKENYEFFSIFLWILTFDCVCGGGGGGWNYLFGFVGNDGAVIFMLTFLNHIIYGIQNIFISINFLIMF